MDPETQIVYRLLNQKYMLLIKEPNVDTLCNLQNFIENQCSPEFIESNYELLFNPLKMFIASLPDIVKISNKTKLSSGEQLLLKCLEVLNTIFKKCSIKKEEIFENFLSMSSILLSDNNNDLKSNFTKVISMNEDLYLAVLENLNILFDGFDAKIFFKSYKLKAQIGFLINTLLNLIQQKTYYLLRLNAINLISKIYLQLIDHKFNDYDFCINFIGNNNKNIFEASTFIAFTLPSIASNMFKLINLCSNQDYAKLHPTVIISILKLLSIVLQIVFWPNQKFPKNNSKVEAQPSIEHLMNANLNDLWFEQTSKRLTIILFRTIDILLEHHDQLIRECLFNFFTNLLNNCCEKFVLKFLKICLKVPLNYYSIKQCDDIFGISKTDQSSIDFHDKCQHFLTMFHKKIMERFSNCDEDETVTINITNYLHEEFFSHILRIPFLFRNLNISSITNDSIKTANSQLLSTDNLISSFQVFIGFVNVLNQDGLYDFIKVEQHMFILFRTLVNVAEFDFNSNSLLIEYENVSYKWDHLSTNINELKVKDLFTIFKLDKQMLYLNDSHLLLVYLSSLCQLVRCSNYNSYQIIMDHLENLLITSEFEPSVILVMNAIICGSRELSFRDRIKSNLLELINLYLHNIDLTQLYITQDLAQSTQNLSDELSSTNLSNLMSICTVDSNLTESKQVVSKMQSSKRNILKHCLLLQGMSLLYTMFESEQFKILFYQKCFCQFLESYAINNRFVATIAETSLVFIGQRFSKEIANNKQEIICKMILHNLDYLYNTFSVVLDYSVLQQCEPQSNSTNTFTLFYDHYSLKTVQVSLLSIFQLLSTYHQSIEVISDSQMEYFHRLIDQAINIIKFYSLNPHSKYAASLNRLLEVLHGYVGLLSIVYDHDYQYHRNRIDNISNSTDLSVENIFNSLCEFTKNYKFFKHQLESNFMDNQSDADVEPNLETKLTEKEENILQSPIIKSRAGNILYLCSMLLSDTQIEIRLNTLNLAIISMKLLRSYEDILLPYVHKLWDPLVNRFSSDFDHPLIMKRAFDCLMIASEFCGDFLLSRTKRNVLPRLIQFLHNRLESRFKHFSQHQKVNSIKSVEYHAEFELLSSLGELAVNLKFRSPDIWKFLPVLFLYLCLKGVPEELQQCALQSLLTISNKLDSSSVLFYLHRIITLYYPGHMDSYSKSVYKCEPKLCLCDSICSNMDLRKYEPYFQAYKNTLFNDLINNLMECR